MEKRIAIIGGGIHGVSIAYYLATKYQLASTIIEATSLAAAASGKSGGFLARDWGSGPTVPLHEISFTMHEQLANELSLSTYRKITTLEVDGNVKRGQKRKSKGNASWLDGEHTTSHVMDDNTAQVTSLELVQRMWEVCEEFVGSKFVLGRALGLIYADDGDENNAHPTSVATGVQIQLTSNNHPDLGAKGDMVSIDADVVVLAMGPWTAVAVEDWCGYMLPMEGIKSTSLVFHNLPALGTEEPFACFCAEDDVENCHLEIYPRSNNDVYICGIGGSDHVAGDRLRYPHGDCAAAERIEANPQRVQAAYRALSHMSSIFARRCENSSSNSHDANHSAASGADVMQACMRPCTSDALPVMGLIPDTSNVYVSTGHNCWGILWAPVCGLAMSELIVSGRASTINLHPFRPERILQATHAHLQKKEKHKQELAIRNAARGRKQVDKEVGEQW